MPGVVMKNVQFEDCDLHYASVDRARLTAVTLRRCDLSEAALTELRLRSLKVQECRLVKTSFFKTALRSIAETCWSTMAADSGLGSTEAT